MPLLFMNGVVEIGTSPRALIVVEGHAGQEKSKAPCNKRIVVVLLRGECEDTAFSFEVPVGKGRGKEGS